MLFPNILTLHTFTIVLIHSLKLACHQSKTDDPCHYAHITLGCWEYEHRLQSHYSLLTYTIFTQETLLTDMQGVFQTSTMKGRFICAKKKTTQHILEMLFRSTYFPFLTFHSISTFQLLFYSSP